jgi:pyruvate dehydrogenase E2 component (dihydrolipoamide acetyltransferase)
MPTEVLVPPLGQTVDALTLVSWYKREGDTVQHGEPLYSVETDKATLDVEAPATGVLRQVTARPGDVVKVLSAIARIEAEAEVKVEAEQVSASTLASPRLFVSPRARRLAEAEGVPLAEVKATGPEGAIVERDVRAYLQGSGIRDQESGDRGQASGVTGSAPQPAGGISPVARRIAEDAGVDWQAIAGTGPRGQITREDVAAALEQRSGGAEGQRGGGAEVARQLPATTPAEQAVQLPASSFPFSGIRALIAERMVAGHSQTAPVTLTSEADATALVELRQKLAADGVAVSYNDLFLAILAKALGEHPRLNASLDGDAIKLWPQIDIAVAVDTERGLLAPVVRGVDRKGLAQLAAGTAALAERARGGKCTPDELTGSTFTLTNLGMFGIDAFTPIINLPECAILGVGRIKTQPVWAGDHIEPRETVWLSLTFDHRLVDGGPAARFLQRVAQLAEKPHLLMA